MQAFTAANPFQMMVDPAETLKALERLDAATQLQRRVCRPLDKPALVAADDAQAAFDRTIDRHAVRYQD